MSLIDVRNGSGEPWQTGYILVKKFSENAILCREMKTLQERIYPADCVRETPISDKAKELFTKSVERMESVSMREWAQTEHNKPLLLQIAQNAINNGKDPDIDDDVLNFSTYMTVLAMG